MLMSIQLITQQIKKHYLPQMKLHHKTVPTQLSLLNEIVAEANILNIRHKQYLKKNIQKKYMHHVGMLQYNKLREVRFIQSQRNVLQKQKESIEKAKQFISLKQQKAVNNKNYSTIQRSKRIQNYLQYWQTIVEKNKDSYNQKIKQSTKIIKGWNDKLSSCSARKSSMLNRISENMRQKSSRNHRSVIQQQHYIDVKKIKKQKNSEKQLIINNARHRLSKEIDNTNYKSRISMEKKKLIEEHLLEKSLVTTIEKSQKINKARYLKYYMFERKKKQQKYKEDSIKRLRENHLQNYQDQMNKREKILDEKFRSTRRKKRDKDTSLPCVNGNKSTQNPYIVVDQSNVDGPSCNSRNKVVMNSQRQENHQVYQPYYDKIIMEKLRNLSLIMRQRQL